MKTLFSLLIVFIMGCATTQSYSFMADKDNPKLIRLTTVNTTRGDNLDSYLVFYCRPLGYKIQSFESKCTDVACDVSICFHCE
jgi:hypothetical protein